MSSPGVYLHKDRAKNCRCSPGETPCNACTPRENPTSTDFEEYEEVQETVSLDLSEENVTWVASKISGATWALGAEAIEMSNWLLCFGCASEEFRVVVDVRWRSLESLSPIWLTGWLTPPPPP